MANRYHNSVGNIFNLSDKITYKKDIIPNNNQTLIRNLKERTDNVNTSLMIHYKTKFTKDAHPLVKNLC